MSCLFGCNAKDLRVKSDHTEVPNKDDNPVLFIKITYHLYCTCCGEEYNISYSKTTEEFDKPFKRLR